MPVETLSPRERWLAVLTRQKPDRVPMDYWTTPEAHERLKAYLGGTCNECNVMPVCRQCHDADNSPTFNYREALKQMRHATGQARTIPGPLPQ